MSATRTFRLVLAHQFQGLVAIGGFRDHLHAFERLEQEPNSSPDDGVVVGNDDSDDVHLLSLLIKSGLFLMDDAN